MSAIALFHAKRVLDFSAGWGDRLAGAIAANVDIYHAFDPNSALKQGHQSIIDTFIEDKERKMDFKIEYVPFETADLGEEKYDLVFTSPPFFDFEVYTQEAGQSILSYREFDDWVVRFLFMAIKKSWENLVDGGHVVVHITDVFRTRVCERMCLFVLAYLPMSQYLGVICSRGLADRPRPLWIFQKKASQNDRATEKSIRSDAESELRRLYPTTYRLVQRVVVHGDVHTAEVREDHRGWRERETSPRRGGSTGRWGEKGRDERGVWASERERSRGKDRGRGGGDGESNERGREMREAGDRKRPRSGEDVLSTQQARKKPLRSLPVPTSRSATSK